MNLQSLDRKTEAGSAKLDSHKPDDKVLGFAREMSAITLFVLAPVLQIVFFRWLPFAMLLALVCILMGYSRLGLQSFINMLNKYRNLDLWSKPVKIAVGLYYLGLVWRSVTLIWSPLPGLGIRDVLILAVAPPLTLILASELTKISPSRFAKIFITGFVLTSALLCCELTGFSSLHQLSKQTAHIFDLNRNAVFLTILFWPFVLLVMRRLIGRATAFIAVLIYLAVIFLTESQSAQLALVLSVISMLIMMAIPRIYAAVWIFMALACLVFPFVIAPLETATSEIRVQKIPRSAEHRIQFWKGYAAKIIDHPIAGHGARAHRSLGRSGQIGGFAEQTGQFDKTTHPHNMALEFWVDYGFIGVFLLALTLLAIGASFWGFKRSERTVFASQAVAILVYGFVGAAFMQGWWLATICIGVIAMSASTST